MTLLGILLVLACERLLSHVRAWRRWGWYERLLAWLHHAVPSALLWDSGWGLLALAGGPVLLAVWAQSMVRGGAGLGSLLFGAFVLLFSLGPRDVGEEVHALLDAMGRGDVVRAHRLMRDLSRLPGEGPMPLSEASTPALAGGVLVQAHERLFGALIWFFVLGPVGAVLYRTAAALPGCAESLGAGEALQSLARHWHALVAWIPSRVLALLYGLAGSGDDALRQWREQSGRGGDWTRGVWMGLAAAGCGALRVDHQRAATLGDNLHRALALIDRTLLLLLALFALVTLPGWLA